ADDAVREAAAQRLARPRLAPDGRPCARLARAVDARRRGAGRREGVPRTRQEVAMSDVLTAKSGSVFTVTLNRPAVYTASNRSLPAALADALVQAAAPEIRAVVSTGAGRGFCAGQDLKEFQQLPGTIRDALEATYHPNIRAIRALEKPVIAAINGPC